MAYSYDNMSWLWSAGVFSSEAGGEKKKAWTQRQGHVLFADQTRHPDMVTLNGGVLQWLLGLSPWLVHWQEMINIDH